MEFTSLQFIDVTRTFGRRRALNRVSLSADAGTITALLGHNGAGKSTLLSIAATLLQPTSGEVRYGTHVTSTSSSALRGRIGMLETHLQRDLALERQHLEAVAERLPHRRSAAITPSIAWCACIRFSVT